MLTLSPYSRLCRELCRLWLPGRSPIAPGTCAAAVACMLAPFLFLPFSLGGRIAILLGIFFVGSIAATEVENTLGESDPGEIVIDELLGQWIAMLPFVTLGIWEIVFLFILFRFFDILKPWPVKASERWLPAGYGVMVDDVVAGLWALCIFLLVTGVIRYFF